jgi:hypothetical protein
MKTHEELRALAMAIYRHQESGECDESVSKLQTLQRDAYRQARLDMAEVLRNCPSQMSEYEYRQEILSAPDKP